jgi:predicted Zn-dependent protease
MKWILAVFALMLFNLTKAQTSPQRCATAIKEKQLSNSILFKKTKEEFESRIKAYVAAKKQFKSDTLPVVTIPVVVHVVHNNLKYGQKQNITDEAIYSQIAVLNKDYRRLNTDTNKALERFKAVATDCRIQFCLAKVDPNCNPTTGIVRVSNGLSEYSIDDSDLNDLKKLSYWPSDTYLNIWVTNLQSPYIGLSAFPYGTTTIPGLEDSGSFASAQSDGVVIDYTTFGTVGASLSKTFNMGRTATHEIGHWLGLRHTWGDEDCGTDYCEDTPTSKDATSGCERLKACDNTEYVMIENYMDYSNDACMSIFTHDQSSRIRAVLNESERRSQLVLNNKCAAVAEVNHEPVIETFEDTLAQYFINSELIDIANIGAFGLSERSSRFSINSSQTVLQTNILNLEDYPKNTLSFDLALGKINQILNFTSTLVISYSVGCTNVWTKLSVTSLNVLNTKNTIPQIEDWQRFAVTLGALPSKYVKLKFEISNPTNEVFDIYVDNVFGEDFTSTGLVINYDYSNKQLVFAPTFIGGHKNLEFSIYAIDGKRVYQNVFQKIAPTKIYVSDLVLQNQLYFVKAVFDNKTYYYKFAILR